MAYEVYERLPGGGAKSYRNTESGEIISARQYRNRTEAQKSGFSSISEKQRAQRAQRSQPEPEQPNPLVGRYQKSKYGFESWTHELGLPVDLETTIKLVLDTYSPTYTFALAATVYYLDDRVGQDGIKVSQTQTYRNAPYYVRNAITELRLKLSAYGVVMQVAAYHLFIYPTTQRRVSK